MGAYTKHTWATGEVITAEHLNNLEEGVAGINNGTITSGEAAHAASADKATKDANGNVIADTYAEKDGYYADMSVGGTAGNLQSSVNLAQSAEISGYRTTGGDETESYRQSADSVVRRATRGR